MKTEKVNNLFIKKKKMEIIKKSGKRTKLETKFFLKFINLFINNLSIYENWVL